MKAEKFIDSWLNRKYAGAKEVGDWTHGEVISLLKDFQKQVWEDVKEIFVESDDDEDNFLIEIVELEDLKKILEIET